MSMRSMMKFMIKQGQLQFDFINANWLQILKVACTSTDDATVLWQFLAQYSTSLNTEMYKHWGVDFRKTLTSSQARENYTLLYDGVEKDVTLGILKELLALCNSTGGITYYRTFFRPLVLELFPQGTIIERTGDPNVIGAIDIQNGHLLIN